MKKTVLCFLVIGSSFILLQYSFGKSTIYKCMDELGRPIFSQQSTCVKPETVNYSSKQLADKEKQRKEEKNKKAALKQKKQCEEAKATYASYKSAPFLTKKVFSDGKVRKVRLTKDEAMIAVADAEQEKNYWCNK